jgi:hypothetical protein
VALQSLVNELVSFDTSDRTEEEEVKDAVDILPTFLLVIFFTNEEKMAEVSKSLGPLRHYFSNLKVHGKYRVACKKNEKEGGDTLESTSDNELFASVLKVESHQDPYIFKGEEVTPGHIPDQLKWMIDDIVSEDKSNRTEEEKVQHAIDDLHTQRKITEAARQAMDEEDKKADAERGYPATTWVAVKTEEAWAWDDERYVKSMEDSWGKEKPRGPQMGALPNYPWEETVMKTAEDWEKMKKEKADKEEDYWKIKQNLWKWSPYYDAALKNGCPEVDDNETWAHKVLNW